VASLDQKFAIEHLYLLDEGDSGTNREMSTFMIIAGRRNSSTSAGFAYCCRLYRLNPRASRSKGASNKLVGIESMAGI